MGIKGLRTYFETKYFPNGTSVKANCWERINLQGKLVIDGDNVCHELFRKVNHIYPDCGGQYPLFLSIVEKFFLNLHKSNVEAVVVFDGIDDEQREQAVAHRKKDKICNWARIVTPETIEGRVSPSLYKSIYCPRPLLAKKAFIQALESMKNLNVKFGVVDREADPVVAALANHLQCPVLANDSDYYMFNLEVGYIPMEHFDWEKVPVTAFLYNRAKFCREKKLTSIVLSIPAILGNDVINTVKILLEKICGSQDSFAVGLVDYLVNNKFKSIQDLLDSVPVDVRHQVLVNYGDAQQYYEGSEVVTMQTLSSTDVVFDCNQLPAWIINQYRQGKISRCLMSAAVQHKTYLPLVLDNPREESAHNCTRKVRQAMYGIFMPQQQIVEYFRHDLDVTNEVVDSISCIEGYQIPTIHSIKDLDNNEKMIAMKNILGLGQIPDNIDDYWKLVVVASCYWYRECKPTKLQVKALVFTLIKHKSCIIPKIFEKSSYKYDLLPNRLDTLHIYAQWQCAYFETINLNGILDSPLPVVSPGVLFDGQQAIFHATTGSAKFLNNAKTKQDQYEMDLFDRLLGAILIDK